MEKKLPQTLATLLTPEMVQGRKVRLMFQDEARFGRMARIRRCWAPYPFRPVVANGYERQFTYVYGAVSPLEGQLDWCICDKMNSDHMSAFLSQVSAAHPHDFIVMIVDGASSHKSKQLAVPQNMKLLLLPPYSPQLNPQENIWDEVREKNFPNRVFNHMDAVKNQLIEGLTSLASNAGCLRSIAFWPWINNLILNDF